MPMSSPKRVWSRRRDCSPACGEGGWAWRSRANALPCHIDRSRSSRKNPPCSPSRAAESRGGGESEERNDNENGNRAVGERCTGRDVLGRRRHGGGCFPRQGAVSRLRGVPFGEGGRG